MINMLRLSPYCFPEQVSSSHLSRDLNQSFIKEGINSLNAFDKKMIDNALKQPAFRMILTSHGVSKKTEEGIYIIPITLLKN